MRVPGSIYRLTIYLDGPYLEVCGAKEDLAPHYQAWLEGVALEETKQSISGYLYERGVTGPLKREIAVGFKYEDVRAMELEQEPTVEAT